MYSRIVCMRIVKSQFDVHCLVLSFLHEMHIEISDAMQFVESSSDRLSARDLQKISHWISLLYFDNFKHLQFGV